MGTDAGNPLTLHGPSVYAEMEAMQAAGLTPMQVLVASTRGGATAMGRAKDFGTVEKGKLADLLIVGRRSHGRHRQPAQGPLGRARRRDAVDRGAEGAGDAGGEGRSRFFSLLPAPPEDTFISPAFQRPGWGAGAWNLTPRPPTRP